MGQKPFNLVPGLFLKMPRFSFDRDRRRQEDRELMELEREVLEDVSNNKIGK